MKPAKVNKTNDFVGSSYADLTSVIEACKKPLSDNGLAFTQIFFTAENGVTCLATYLLHVSGQRIESMLPLLNVKDAHSLGSAITYARRYALCSLLGIAPEGEDDDGNLAQKTATSKRQPPASRKNFPKRAPQATIKQQALDIIAEVEEADEFLRNKEIDPGDPPKAMLERIVKLGPDGLKKAIADGRKKAEAKLIVAEADRVEPIEEKEEAKK